MDPVQDMESETKIPELTELRVAVIGLGYVGLPLAVEISGRYPCVGFDLDQGRVAELGRALDRTGEVTGEDLAAALDRGLSFTTDSAVLSDCNLFIIAVPTPVDRHKRPDLGPVVAASRTVAGRMRPGSVVVYESTVYPGATEEVCVPALEEASGLVFNRDFFVGYSPERVNPGDREHRLTTIVKVTSGSTPEAARLIDRFYAGIVPAGTFAAASIMVAEAAKVIENVQRDVNIALMNELALIFSRLGIDTMDVLAAARTKWNFLPFSPGLVGGHCIGIDPYYLIQKAQEVGVHPELILASRRINDRMAEHVVDRVVRLMLKARIAVAGARVLIMGLAFKENCPDLRNTRVVDIVRELSGFGAEVSVHDPMVDPEKAEEEYGISLVQPEAGYYDAIIIAVAHRQFAHMGIGEIRKLGRPGAVVFDVKHIFPAGQVDGRL